MLLVVALVFRAQEPQKDIKSCDELKQNNKWFSAQILTKCFWH